MNNKLKTFLSIFFVLALGFLLIACNPTVHTVTFNSDGGTSVEAIKVEDGKLATKPTDPTKEGYEFVHWQLDGEEFLFTTPIKADITLKALWDEDEAPATFTVTFDSDGGSNVASQTVEDGKLATKPADPTKVGHTFVEWQLNGVAFNFATAITANTTLKAKWQADTPAFETVTVTITATLPENTPAGDIYVSGDLKNDAVTTTWSGADLKATRTGQTATLVLEYDVEDLPLTIDYKWTRGSWENVEKGADGEELDNRKITITVANETVTVSDTVVSWADSGTDPEPNVLTVPGLNALHDTEVEGTFTGEGIVLANNTGSSIVYVGTAEGPVMISYFNLPTLGDVTFADIEIDDIISFTGTVNTANGGDYARAKHLVPTEITIETDMSYDDVVFEPIVVADLATLFTVENYAKLGSIVTVRFTLATTGAAVDATQYSYFVGYSTSGATRAGLYKIDGSLFELEQEYEITTFFLGTNNDVPASAIFRFGGVLFDYDTVGEPVEKVTVTYMDGETTLETVEVTKGQAIADLLAPTKEGFAFLGWFTDAELENEFDDTITLDDDIKLYAKWEETEDLTATLFFDGTSSGVMTDGNNAALVNLNPELFTVTSTLRRLQEQFLQHVAVNAAGHLRIYGNANYVSKNTLSVLIGEGFVITGVEIVFLAGSNNPSSALLMLGAQANDLVADDIITTTKTYTDLSIDGFSIRNNQSTGSGNSQIWIEKIIITYEEGEATSEFTPIPVIDVTFDLNYLDSTPIIHKFESGDDLTVPADPEREGFEFAGWFTDAEGTTPLVVEGTTVTEAFAAYAKWTEISNETLLAADKDELTLSPLQFTNDGTITLPATGTNGSTITWESNNTAINAETGAVTLPETPGSYEVILTATLSLGTETPLTKEFTITLLVTDPEDGPVLVTTIDFGTDSQTGYGAGELTANDLTFNKDRVQFNKQTNTNSNLTVGAVMAPVPATKTAFFTFAYADVAKLEFDVITWATGTTVRTTATLLVRFSTDGGTTWQDSDNFIGSVQKTEVTTLTVLAPEGVTHVQFFYGDEDASGGNTNQAIVIDNIKIYK